MLHQNFRLQHLVVLPIAAIGRVSLVSCDSSKRMFSTHEALSVSRARS